MYPMRCTGLGCPLSDMKVEIRHITTHSTSKYLASEVLKQADLSPGYRLEDLNVQAHHPYSEIALKCSS